MGDADADPVLTNVELAGGTDWTADEVGEILDPYDKLYVRAISRHEDLRPDVPPVVRYQLTEDGNRLFE